jgi:hypothetical protein
MYPGIGRRWLQLPAPTHEIKYWPPTAAIYGHADPMISKRRYDEPKPAKATVVRV